MAATTPPPPPPAPPPPPPPPPANASVSTSAAQPPAPAMLDLTKHFREPWYLGCLPRDNAEFCLRKRGDFGIRVDARETSRRLVGMLKGSKTTSDNTLETDGKLWWLARRVGKKAPTINLLIDFYRRVAMPSDEPGLLIGSANTRPNWLLARGDLEVGPEKLGSGNFCDVFPGVFKKTTKAAVKVCRPGKENTETAEAMVSEAAVMKDINHVNIVKFYGISCDEPPIQIAMELCSGGSLTELLAKKGASMTVQERMRYITETASGMAFLHKKDLIHRDLAARNLLLTQDNTVKISDFGLSKNVNKVSGENLGKVNIPLRWTAPEALSRVMLCTKACDIWSYGVLVYEVFNNGVAPFVNLEPKDVANHIKNVDMPEMPPITPKHVKDMMKKGIWIKEPEDRWSFAQIVEHLGMKEEKLTTSPTQVSQSDSVVSSRSTPSAPTGPSAPSPVAPSPSIPSHPLVPRKGGRTKPSKGGKGSQKHKKTVKETQGTNTKDDKEDKEDKEEDDEPEKPNSVNNDIQLRLSMNRVRSSIRKKKSKMAESKRGPNKTRRKNTKGAPPVIKSSKRRP